MKRTLHSLLIIFTITILIIDIFTYSPLINKTIYFSINLFLKNVFPSLFPMFLISTILIDIGIPTYLGNIFENITKKLFKTKKEGSFIFFISLISGFPSNAKIINDLLNKNILNINDANKILLFTFFSNPLFIINTVGNLFLNNKKMGIYILISHILGNIILGILYRNYNKNITKNNKVSFKNNTKILINNINNVNTYNIILKGIKESLTTLTMIFGIITFFLIIINIINININNPIIRAIISSILELTTGLKYISILKIPLNIKALLSVFFISFGGLSVHTQIINIFNTKKIKYKTFLLARIIHAFISTSILFLILSIFQ